MFINLSFAFIWLGIESFLFLLKDRVGEEGNVRERWLGPECIRVKRQIILLYLK